MTEPLPPEDEALATEYALSLLDGEERRTFEARLRDEPALAEAVAARQEAFAELAGDLTPVPPPPGSKARLLARLFEPAQPPARGRWIPGWLSGALAASVIVAALVVATAPERFAPGFTAELAAEEGPLRVRAEFDAGRSALRVLRLAGGPPEGRVLELWAIAGDAPPVSLGLLAADTTRLPVPADLAGAFASVTLAISDEPPGGSPTGAPTGDVLAVAPVEAL